MSYRIRFFLPACLMCALVAVGCGSGSNVEPIQNDTVIIVTKELPDDREKVNPEPVQVFEKDLKNINNWKFSVKLYETKKRHVYRAVMRYEEVVGEDEINFPNLLQEPQPVLKQGPEPISCMIGFLDKNGTFRDYKLVSIVKGDLRIRTVKYYGTKTTLSTPQ